MTRREQRVINAFINCIKSGTYSVDYAITLIEDNQRYGWLSNEIAKNYPIIVAKTQYSFSDNPDLLGAPDDYELTISDIEVKTGAEFVVLVAGKMSLMPGLPKIPNAEKMKIENGEIFNLK